MADGSKNLPAMIWHEFLVPGSPAKVSFKPRNILKKAMLMTPKEFEFIGSEDRSCNNEESTTWTTLCHRSYADDHPFNKTESRGCKIDGNPQRNHQQLYRCLGIKVTKVMENGQPAALRKIQIWVWDI